MENRNVDSNVFWHQKNVSFSNICCEILNVSSLVESKEVDLIEAESGTVVTRGWAEQKEGKVEDGLVNKDKVMAG